MHVFAYAPMSEAAESAFHRSMHLLNVSTAEEIHRIFKGAHTFLVFTLCFPQTISALTAVTCQRKFEVRRVVIVFHHRGKPTTDPKRSMRGMQHAPLPFLHPSGACSGCRYSHLHRNAYLLCFLGHQLLTTQSITPRGQCLQGHTRR